MAQPLGHFWNLETFHSPRSAVKHPMLSPWQHTVLVKSSNVQALQFLSSRMMKDNQSFFMKICGASLLLVVKHQDFSANDSHGISSRLAIVHCTGLSNCSESSSVCFILASNYRILPQLNVKFSQQCLSAQRWPHHCNICRHEEELLRSS